MFIMVELVYIPFSRRCMFKVVVDISIYIFSKGSKGYNFVTFNCAVQVSKHYNGENETFCVKCGLIADHFSSLVRMRTKSAIADLYGPTV